MCILALSGASEHAPGASHVSISNPRRDPGWRCHRGSSATTNPHPGPEPSQVDAQYSKWLVVLTDTVDFECVNERNQFDKESPARAEAAVRYGLG